MCGNSSNSALWFWDQIVGRTKFQSSALLASSSARGIAGHQCFPCLIPQTMAREVKFATLEVFRGADREMSLTSLISCCTWTQLGSDVIANESHISPMLPESGSVAPTVTACGTVSRNLWWNNLLPAPPKALVPFRPQATRGSISCRVGWGWSTRHLQFNAMTF